jgi:Tol biopolymer transport system component
MVYRGMEQTGDLPNQTVDFLANKFLLRAEVRPGGTWYELVHDRFVEPILQANQKWRLKQPLIQMCKAWLDSGKSPGKLLEGQQLQEALATNWQGLGPLVEEFLEASQAAQAAREEALRTEREAQRQRALEQAQALAEEQRRRAEEQARSSRRLRSLATGLAIIFVVALGVAILAVGQRREAQRQAIAALAAQQTAEAEAVARATAQAQAEARRIEAQRAEGEALAAEGTAVAARAQAEGQRVEAETAQADAIAAQATSESARGTAEARELQAQTAVASQAQALATLSANIEAQLAAAVVLPLAPTSAPTPSPSLTPSPVPPGGTPSGRPTQMPEVLPPGLPTATATSGRLTPTATPTSVPPGGTPAPDLAATATIEALQAQLAQVQATQTAVAAAIPAVSFPPAGRILFVSNRDQQPGTWGDLYANPWGNLYSMNADGGDVRRLIADFGAQPSYSPRGDRIAFSRPHPGQVPGVSLYAMNPDGQAETGMDRRFWDNWEPALSPDGEQVAYVSTRNNRGWEIYIMDGGGPDPDTLLPLTCDRIPPDLDKWGPAWSPDGRRIAFVVQPDAASNGEDAGSADIWVIEVASGDCARLTDDGFMNKRPAWRDSQNLAFISNREGGFDIYAVNLAAPGRLTNLTASPRADEDYAAWSPDGNWLAFSRQVDGQDEIFVMTADGQHLTNLTRHPADDWDPIWIP